MPQKCCTEALLEFWPFSSFLPTSKSLQTTKHTMKSLFSSYLHNHHPAFSKKKISLPNKSYFANLREHTIDLNSSFFFFLTAINVIYFLQHPVNIGGASFLHTKVVRGELGQGERGRKL